MTFLKINHLPYAIGAILLIVLVFFFLNRNYFKWIYTYWFFERTWTSRIATFFYYLSFVLFVVALLDLRGPTEKVSANLPDQKTIIILDSSASMLAEDVRPSRFAKAIQLARHFVKKAAAHQVAVVLFSDVQKRLIPFTDDVDLLDSRLSALEKTNAISGGSNISQAIAEAANYFSTDGDADNASGNILVFTDAEESEDKFPLKLGSKINLAVVGLGTAKGGPIPLRWDDGSFRGYKTSKGEQITTKLDENYIKNLGKNVANYRYWISNSYSLPTDEILGFFKGNYNKVHGQGDMTIRPVLSFYLIIPAILSFILSVILGRFPTFKKAALVLCLVLNPYWLFAQERNEGEKQEKKELPAYVKEQLSAFKSGKLNRSEILKLGEEFLKNERPAESLQLYEEYSSKEDSVEVKFNHATAYLENKKIKEALPLIKDVLASDAPEALKNKMRSNLLLTMKQNDSKENQQKQDQQDKDDKKEDQKENNKDQQQDSKDKNEKQDDKKSDDQKNEGKDQKGDGKSQKNDSGKDQDKKENEGDKPEKDEPKDLKAPPRETKPQTLDEKEKQVEQQRKMVKTPAMVKQILDDDRELQKKMMDTSTKANSKNKRDW